MKGLWFRRFGLAAPGILLAGMSAFYGVSAREHLPGFAIIFVGGMLVGAMRERTSKGARNN